MASIEFYEKRGLYEQAGDLAVREGDYARARELYDKAIDDYSSRGLSARAEGVMSKTRSFIPKTGSGAWNGDIDRIIEGFEESEIHVPVSETVYQTKEVSQTLDSEPIEK